MARAVKIVQEDRYRKRYGLSYRDFLEEPLHVYRNNIMVMNMEARIARFENKRASRGLSSK